MPRSVVTSGWLHKAGQKGRARLNVALTSEMPAWAFFLDFVVFPPLILCGMVRAFAGADAPIALMRLAQVGLGLAGWTLAEYLIHRFAFHHAPGLRQVHMAHHAAPRGLNGTPTPVTVLVFLLTVYWPLSVMLSSATAAALTCGVVTGYLAYVAVHYLVHHHASGGRAWLRRLIRRHARHHHDTAHNFGVTTAFWDRVFGTFAGR